MADSLETKRIMRELDAAVDELCVEIAVGVNRDLEASTPKKTGLASKNWIASHEAVPRGKATYPVAAAAAAQAAGLASIRGFDAKRDKQIVIQNNVPYISDLNDGSSRKAPSGFVQSAIAKALALISRRGRR